MTNLLLPFLLAAADLSRANNISSTAKGTSAATFLETGVGARAEAMGEAFSAVVDDASALYWNPAALTLVESHSLTLMHAASDANTSYFDYGAAAQNLGRYGAVGASFYYFTPGQLAQTDDATGLDLGTLKPADYAASAGYALEWNGYSVGAAIKTIQSKIITTATALAADFGFLTPAYEDQYRFAFAVANWGGRLRYEQESSRLPFTFRGGLSDRLTDRWLVALDGVFPNDNNPYAALGTEYTMAAGKDWSAAARLGFNSRSIADAPGFNGGTIGFGLGWQGVSVDYAFLPSGSLGNTHRVSLSMRWGERPAPPPPPAAPEAPAEPSAKAAEPSKTPASAKDLLENAKIAIEAQDWTGAGRELEIASSVLSSNDPHRVDCLEKLGYVAAHSGSPSAAKSYYAEGIELAGALNVESPAVAEMHAGLGFVLYGEGEQSKAVKEFKKALELKPAEKTRKLVEAKLAELGR